MTDKNPYHFSLEQLSHLSRIIGDHPELSSIHSELGIAESRNEINTVQNKVLRIMNGESSSIPIMLTSHEVHSLLTLELPHDLRNTLGYGL